VTGPQQQARSGTSSRQGRGSPDATHGDGGRRVRPWISSMGILMTHLEIQRLANLSCGSDPNHSWFLQGIGGEGCPLGGARSFPFLTSVPRLRWNHACAGFEFLINAIRSNLLRREQSAWRRFTGSRDQLDQITTEVPWPEGPTTSILSRRPLSWPTGNSDRTR